MTKHPKWTVTGFCISLCRISQQNEENDLILFLSTTMRPQFIFFLLTFFLFSSSSSLLSSSRSSCTAILRLKWQITEIQNKTLFCIFFFKGVDHYGQMAHRQKKKLRSPPQKILLPPSFFFLQIFPAALHEF